MFDFITITLKRNKKLLSNFSYITILRIMTLLIPIITYPYLVRILGIDVYGETIFAYTIGQYFSVLVQFGFSLSATKLIAENIGKKSELNRIFLTVFFIKISIFIASLVAFTLLYNLFLSDNIYIYAFIYAIGDIFLLNWFYQGKQEMRMFAIFGFFSKLITLILIFKFIHVADDNYLYCLFSSLSYIIVNLGLFFYSIKRENFKFDCTEIKFKKQFKDSFYIFLSRVPIVIVEKLNIVLLGNFVSSASVSYYDLAAKLTALMQLPFNVFNQVYYPKAATEKNKKKVTRVIGFVFLASLIVYIFTNYFSGLIIKLYAGDNMYGTVHIFLIYSIIAPLNAISHNLGNCVLLVHDKVADFNKSVYIPAIVFIAMSLLLVLFESVSLTNVTYLIVLYVALICGLRGAYAVRIRN